MRSFLEVGYKLEDMYRKSYWGDCKDNDQNSNSLRKVGCAGTRSWISS